MMCLAGVLATVLAYITDNTHIVQQSRGFLFPSPGQWINDPTWSFIAALAVDIAAFAGIFAMNRSYNLVLDASYLPAGLFMVLQGATAVSTGVFAGGGLMLLTVLASTAMLYGIYQRPDKTRRVLGIFVLLGMGMLTQYGFIPFIIVYIVGCIQMRIISLRTLIAIIAGLLTPAWIILGSGIEPLDSLRWPQPVNPFANGISMSQAALLATVLISLVSGLVFGMMNMVTVYTRNAKTRAFNGLMAGTGIMAGIMCAADFTNIDFYIPVLNLTSAYQLGLFYSLKQTRGANIIILSLCGLYALTFIWSLCQP